MQLLVIYPVHQHIMGPLLMFMLGGMYFAHGGAWLRLNDEASGPVTKYTAGVNGSSAYTFTGPGATSGNNPNFTFYKGHTYLIDNTANVSSHPLQIRHLMAGLLLQQG